MSKKPATKPRAQPTKLVTVTLEMQVRVPRKRGEHSLSPGIYHWLSALHAAFDNNPRVFIQGDIVSYIDKTNRVTANLYSKVNE